MVAEHTLQTSIRGYLAVLGRSNRGDSRHILGSLAAVESHLQRLGSPLAGRALAAVLARERINHEHSAAVGSQEKKLAGELANASQTASELLVQVLDANP